VTTKFINDIGLPLVQVIQETDALGNLLTSYTIGNDLISSTNYQLLTIFSMMVLALPEH